MWPQVYGAQGVEYGCLNEYDFNSLVCVNTLFQAGETERWKDEEVWPYCIGYIPGSDFSEFKSFNCQLKET